MMAGQELVLTLIESVMRSPAWKKSLIVITYDEHGGFYDHVDPGQFTAADDRRLMRRYGVRVPALVVSPYVERGVSHVVYDHTSIIKTILLRFCKRPDTVAKSMGARVAAANHLGSLLTRAASNPRGRASNQQLTALVEKVAAWRRTTYRETTLGETARAEGAVEAPALTDLQEEVVAMSKRLRAAGLQPGEP
jgi:phospholipase C